MGVDPLLYIYIYIYMCVYIRRYAHIQKKNFDERERTALSAKVLRSLQVQGRPLPLFSRIFISCKINEDKLYWAFWRARSVRKQGKMKRRSSGRNYCWLHKHTQPQGDCLHEPALILWWVLMPFHITSFVMLQTPVKCNADNNLDTSRKTEISNWIVILVKGFKH